MGKSSSPRRGRSLAGGDKVAGAERYVFRLYVAGGTPASLRAIKNLKSLCEGRLRGRSELEVVDIYQQPGLAKDAHLIAAPTLIKSLPAPVQRFIGDMSRLESALFPSESARDASEEGGNAQD